MHPRFGTLIKLRTTMESLNLLKLWRKKSITAPLLYCSNEHWKYERRVQWFIYLCVMIIKQCQQSNVILQAETSHVHVVYWFTFDWLLFFFFFLMPRLNKHLTGCLFLHGPNNPPGVRTKSFFSRWIQDSGSAILKFLFVYKVKIAMSYSPSLNE